MSDYSIPGVESKFNTPKIIENLMEAERIPLKKMEADKEELVSLKSTWLDIRQTLQRLNTSTKRLYGFENPFNEKSVVSSNDSILTAETEKNALDENISFKVEKLASADRMISDETDKDYKLSKGVYSFQIGDEEISLKYRGGTLSDFVKKLNKKKPDLLRATVVKNTSKTQVFLIESLKTGKENRLEFKEDSVEMGLELGLIKPNPGASKDLTLSSLSSYTGDFSPLDKGYTVAPESSVTVDLNENVNKNDTISVQVRISRVPKEEIKAPEKSWSVPGASLQGVSVKSAAGEVPVNDAPKEPEAPEKPLLNLLSVTSGGEILDFPPLKESDEVQTLSLKLNDSGELTSLTLNNPNKEFKAELIALKHSTGDTDQKYIAVNPISTASDARLEMNGMEITRETNDIDDLVEGVTLHLHDESDENVSLKVDFDTEVAKEAIYQFVDDYNNLVRKILILTKEDDAILNEIDFNDEKARERAEEIQGTLRGDRSLNSIKQTLARIVMSAYPTDEEDGYSLLASIGISTNATGTSGTINKSKLRGYLELDVDKLDNALKNNIQSVKDLFGQDTTGDLIINTGIAKEIDQFLIPYTRTGGTIAIKLSMLDNNIKRADKEIDNYNDHLVRYEENIRRKYGNMEAVLNSLESSTKAIENLNSSEK